MARRPSCQTRSGLNGRTQALRSKAQRTARNRRASLGRSYQCSETAARIPAPGTSHVPVGECRCGVADKKGRPRRTTFFFNLSSEWPLASEFCCRDAAGCQRAIGVAGCSKELDGISERSRRSPRRLIHVRCSLKAMSRFCWRGEGACGLSLRRVLLYQPRHASLAERVSRLWPDAGTAA